MPAAAEDTQGARKRRREARSKRKDGADASSGQEKAACQLDRPGRKRGKYYSSESAGGMRRRPDECGTIDVTVTPVGDGQLQHQACSAWRRPP